MHGKLLEHWVEISVDKYFVVSLEVHIQNTSTSIKKTHIQKQSRDSYYIELAIESGIPPRTHTLQHRRGPPDVQNTKISCGLFLAGFHVSDKRQRLDMGHSKLASSIESGTKIWHVIFASIIKINLYIPVRLVM